jgi:uncharacterized protein
MDPIKIDFSIVARDLKLAPQNVESAVALLDAGNTIPFITRFRKDETAGLDEHQLLAIRQKVAQLRSLAERKATILRAIDGQEEATEEVRKRIEATSSSRRLEDLYQPFKTKKKSRASAARQQGLAPLADEILTMADGELDLASRATEFVRVDKGLNSVDEVIAGVSDLIVEKFSQNEALKANLRKLYRESAVLCSEFIESSPSAPPTAVPGVAATPCDQSPSDAEQSTSNAISDSKDPKDVAGTTTSVAEVAPTKIVEAISGEKNASTDLPESPLEVDSASATNNEPAVQPKKKRKKKKKKKKPVDPFKEFDGLEQPISKLPHHRALAINRGERAGKIKVKLKIDSAKATELAIQELVSAEHPAAEFLKKCAGDVLTRSLLPSVERELRRDVTEQAEKHAVEVFANNLRNLLLQPPIRNRKILAIDPGYKRGCSVAVLDPCGNLLESGQVFIVGNQTRQDESKTNIRDWVKKHSIDIIAIGNGSACREVEQMVSDTIAEHLSDDKVQYTVVNEAGASVYSTSEIGREDFPDLAPAVRSAVSIGRRLQDPLSELVKISPAHIGVGMYQHDVKSKHLSESLDDVVQFCVNRVGVDVNTSSQALLKYVSGLNALTARRVVEHRAQNGRFNSRDQFKSVTGFGEATCVQSSGFLRIHGGENPLDATGIHPESYPVANDILSRVDAKVEEIFPRWLMQPASIEIARLKSSTPDIANDSATATPEVSTSDSAKLEVAKSATGEASDSEASETNQQLPVSVSTPSETVENPAAPPVPSGESVPSAEAKEESQQSSSIDRREFDERRKEITKKLSELDLEEIAKAHNIGTLAVKDIVMTLKRPAWDPRDKVKKPIFRRGILKADDLKPEMQLDAQVVNVVDFGVFVDIGLGDSSLVHVSRLSSHYVADPHKVYAVGDTMKVWVTEVSSEQRRVKLTAIRPGTKKPSRRGRPNRGKPNPDTAKESKSKDRRPSGSNPSSDEPKRGGRRPGKYDGFRGGGGGRRDTGHFKKDKRRSKPKPIKPITDKMLTGDEPMRSFSDLAQFVKRKPEDSKRENKESKNKPTD